MLQSKLQQGRNMQNLTSQSPLQIKLFDGDTIEFWRSDPGQPAVVLDGDTIEVWRSDSGRPSVLFSNKVFAVFTEVDKLLITDECVHVFTRDHTESVAVVYEYAFWRVQE